jgi:hypothetical protein
VALIPFGHPFLAVGHPFFSLGGLKWIVAGLPGTDECFGQATCLTVRQVAQNLIIGKGAIALIDVDYSSFVHQYPKLRISSIACLRK